MVGEIRTFDTGATRDSDKGKFDYEGFLCPLVIERFGQYMHRHREQSDGSLRASDNWQKGIPPEECLKSMWRHLMEAWKITRGYSHPYTLDDALCGVMFNAMAYLHVVLKKRHEAVHGAKEV